MPGPKFQGHVRQERGRPAEQYPGAKPGQEECIGASYAGVQYVAGDRHGDALEQGSRRSVLGAAQGAKHGSHIQQRLGRMFVHTIAGVQHRQAGGLRQQVRSAGGKVAQDNALRAQRAQGDAGVFE